jgi:hypothetical protein
MKAPCVRPDTAKPGGALPSFGGRRRIDREIREIGREEGEDWKIRKMGKGREGGERGED